MSQLIRYVCIYNYRSLHIRYQYGCNTYMHKSLTISMLSCLRRNMSWIYSKSNMISQILSVLAPKILGSYRAQMLLRPSLHALVYQLCILFIKLGIPSIKEWGRKSLPYSNFIGQSGKYAVSSTQHNDRICGQCGARKSLVVWWH